MEEKTTEKNGLFGGHGKYFVLIGKSKAEWPKKNPVKCFICNTEDEAKYRITEALENNPPAEVALWGVGKRLNYTTQKVVKIIVEV